MADSKITDIDPVVRFKGKVLTEVRAMLMALNPDNFKSLVVIIADEDGPGQTYAYNMDPELILTLEVWLDEIKRETVMVQPHVDFDDSYTTDD